MNTEIERAGCQSQGSKNRSCPLLTCDDTEFGEGEQKKMEQKVMIGPVLSGNGEVHPRKLRKQTSFPVKPRVGDVVEAIKRKELCLRKDVETEKKQAGEKEEKDTKIGSGRCFHDGFFTS